MALGACGNDVENVSSGIGDYYYIERMKKLKISPAYEGNGYRWTMRTADGTDSLLGTEKDYIFLAEKEGTYHITFTLDDGMRGYRHSFPVTVLHEEVEYSPYITRVYDYRPAPGQFINEMPRYEEGDTYGDILKKAEEAISGTNDEMISLGGWGGYVTFGFDHTVINVPGQRDFRIWGNAFYELVNPEKKGGSAEPGIVCVSYDENCNGIPDDPWYELAGSEYHAPQTLHNYSMTYHRPDPDRRVVADEDNSIDDLYYIAWTDNRGASGFMPKNIFHNQEYFPKWVEADTVTFTGSRLAPNAADLSGTGTYYVLYSYPWGYVDNHPNEYEDLNSFDISWAVDDRGNHVNLPGADFIRVYTGLNQYCGWIGETSTELCRAQDLHIPVVPYAPVP